MFDTPLYWSESQKAFIGVDAMALPYAMNVYKKCLREHEQEFVGSVLQKTLLTRLAPSRGVAKTVLAARGECAYARFAGASDEAIRRFFYSIGKALGVKVATEIKGEFIIATCEPVDLQVNVNRV